MEKKILIFVIISIMGLSLFAQIVPDDNFRMKINEALGQPVNYQPTIIDLNGLTGTLNARYCSIYIIEGAQYLTNLTSLNLFSNQISDISALSGLTNLTELFLSSNQISNISALSGLSYLTRLYLDFNLISDISSLSGLTNLYILTLYDNQITDIFPLVENIGLGSDDFLFLEDNGLTNPLSCEAIEIHIPLLQNLGFSGFSFPEAANLNAACYPSPTRHAENVAYGSELSWDGAEVGTTYEVFLGTSNDNLISIGEGEYIGDNTFTISSELLPDTDCWWRVKSTNGEEELWSGIWHFTTDHWIVLNDEILEIIRETFLQSAYPNPFNPITTIKFSVKENETAKLRIYNLKGQIVKSYPFFSSGNHLTQWNGTDNFGNKVCSGVYFYKLKSESAIQVRKMLMLK